MKQGHSFSTQRNLNFIAVLGTLNKFNFGVFYLIIFAYFFSPTSANAIDITKQLYNPLNNPIGRELDIRPQREEADRLLRLGQQQYASGSIEKTVESGLQALEIYHSLGDMKSQGLTYDLLASAYIQLGDIKNAEDVLRRRVGIARDNQDFQNQIFALNNLGTLLLQKGEPKAAGQTIQDALVIARNVENIKGQGLSLSNLSIVHTRLGDYNQGIKLAETALIFRRQAGDVFGEINTFNNLGDAYLLARDYENTIGSYGAAMRLAKINFYRPNQLRAIDGLVTAHAAVGRYDRALELTAERYSIVKFLQSPQEELKYLASSGELYEKLGDYTKARNFYHQAISLARKLEDVKQEAKLLDSFNNLPKR